jgi:hypothetical protein
MILEMQDVRNTVLHLRHRHDFHRLVVVALEFEESVLELFSKVFSGHQLLWLDCQKVCWRR